ncbi:MAG: ATP-binding protein [Chlamydiales bacterium]|nr:ATP-binding protein [Chlamydiales bacterium]
MFVRNISQKALELSKQYPVLALLGPRQSGKTTLAKHLFSNYAYVSLEDLDSREFAQSDPRQFLSQYKAGVIIDEVQHVPGLLSYIQTIVDENQQSGAFILTGSQNFLVHQAISQTLAGRVAILTLLPLSINELSCAGKLTNSADELIFTGFYPRIYARGMAPADWYANYVLTYVEKDVRQIKNITDLMVFQKFLKLCAGRIGQLVNFVSLGNDCGIDQRTARSWLSLLEMSYILFLLPPYFENFNKRLVKSAKIYFYDTGLACTLLGIQSASQVASHYLKGGLFESMVIADLMKQKWNLGQIPHMYFWRDQQDNEVDCLFENNGRMTPLEIKSGQTIAPDYFKGISFWNKITLEPSNGIVVYGGEQNQKRETAHVMGWKAFSTLLK